MDLPPKPRLRQVNRQATLVETTLDQLVAPDHTARVLWDYVATLDLQPFLQTIKAIEGRPGRDATDPRILLVVWMYALCDGVGSARDLEDLCRHHAVYQWLAGGVSLNYHTLADFRTGHAEALRQYFTAHVTALLHAGLIDFHAVAQDGMRVRASAGSDSFHRQATLQECETAVRQQLTDLERQAGEPADAAKRRQLAARKRHATERLARLQQAQATAAALAAKQAERVRLHPKEAQQRGTAKHPARASSTDPEASRMKMADGGTRPAYNAQLMTTVGTGIIVEVDVTTSGSDAGQLGPMLTKMHRDYNCYPDHVMADGGFMSFVDLERAHGLGVTVYLPVKGAAKALAAGKDPYAAKRGDGPGVKAWRARMGTEAGKAWYRRRGETAERPNAVLRQRGWYQVTVRGTAKVRTVLTFHAWAHNVMQTRRLLSKRFPQGWTWTELQRAGGPAERGAPIPGPGVGAGARTGARAAVPRVVTGGEAGSANNVQAITKEGAWREMLRAAGR
jgi:transposase